MDVGHSHTEDIIITALHDKQEAHHEMRQRTWTFLLRHPTRTTKYKTCRSTNQSKRKFTEISSWKNQTCCWIWKQ